MLKNRNSIKDLNGKTPEHYAFLGGRIDIYNQISKSDIKEFKEYIISLRNGDDDVLNEKTIVTLDNQNNFLNCLFDNLNKGNVSNVKKVVKYYLKNQTLKKNLSLEYFTEKILINALKGRNPLILSTINELLDFKNISIAPLVGKYGLISFIEEMKNMNINLFSEIDNKSLLDYAIENKNEDMILEFFKNIEEISNDNLSKYLTKILLKSYKLFISIYNFIISQDKFSSNKINFDYLYNNNSLPVHYNIFFKLDKIDKTSLDLNKIKNNCRDSVISEINKNHYQISNISNKNENHVEKNILQKLFEKNSSSKYNFYIFEHDVSKLKEIFKKLKDYNLFLPHQIIKSKKIWMLKYLPKDIDLFLKDNNNEICFELLKEDFDNFKLLLEIFNIRETKKEKQMYYYLKAVEIIFGKLMKKDKGHQFEILLNKKILKLFECFEENKEYLKNYYNDRNNNLLHIIPNSYYIDKERN